MSANSAIEWTDHTFNPWWGCTKISPGCSNCYAEKIASRFSPGLWGPGGKRVVATPRYWGQPLKWNQAAAAKGVKELVFCASMADVFEERSELDPWRARLWDIIDQTPSLVWQLVTKRPQFVEAMIPDWWAEEFPDNVWIIVSVEDQQTFDERVPVLLNLPPMSCAGLSIEPLLSHIDMSKALTYGDPKNLPWNDLEWVIVGGESGRNARPCNVLSVYDIVFQCGTNDVRCFVKQLGSNVEWLPRCEALSQWPGNPKIDHCHDYYSRVHLKHAKGGDLSEWFECLRVREFPRCYAGEFAGREHVEKNGKL